MSSGEPALHPPHDLTPPSLMFAQERQQQILARLRAQGKVTVEELVAALSVSAPTVRADLAALEGRGLLRRAHGGALPRETSLYEPPFAVRAVARAEAKARIARAAAARVHPGETVILDAGTTTHAVGLALRDRGIAGVTVVTNNLSTALALMAVEGIDVVVIGGAVQRRRRATLGPLAAEFLDRLRADRLFLGINGIDPVAGLTTTDFDAASVKRAMVSHAAETIVVADSAKAGQVAFARIAPLEAVSLWLTDSDLDPASERALLEGGLRAIERA